MPEYIFEIEEEVSDETETFIGWIRRHSPELIRCRDCVWYMTAGCAIEKVEKRGLPCASDFCSYGEKI